MGNFFENENNSQVIQDGRRQKYGKNANQNGMKFADPIYITSPLNKSKQEMFSQTGKINL
jgi:hypothetical protein